MMDQARIDRAVNRIEAALRRVEKAATASSAPTAPAGAGLREERVRKALAQLDELIESLGR